LLQKGNRSFVEESESLLDEMKETINQAIATARTIANNIMPSLLMDYGLIKGAWWSLPNHWARPGQFKCYFEVP
jgi:signal transduction histidine kinase